MNAHGTDVLFPVVMLEVRDGATIPELRAMFVQEVRDDAALDLLQAEPRFRSALAAARRAHRCSCLFTWERSRVSCNGA